MKEYRLSIAIPTYNRKSELEKLLDSIEVQLTETIEVLVSDNCSSDGTEELIMNKYKWVKYYKNEVNEGADRNFLECYNRAKGDYILLLGSDDRMTEGSISHILSYIDKVSCDKMHVIFMNHCFFVNDYHSIEDTERIYLTNTCDKIIYTKKEFMEIAKGRITFMSALLLQREAFHRVAKPEEYLNTYFIHSCITFEVSKDENSVFGWISYPCIAANITPGAAGLDSKLNKYLQVFSYYMKYVLCDVSVENGFDRKQMKKIYIDEIAIKMSRSILKNKLNKNIDIKETFWMYVFPNVCTSLKGWTHIISAYLAPRWIATCLYKYIKPLVGKGKRENGKIGKDKYSSKCF